MTASNAGPEAYKRAIENDAAVKLVCGCGREIVYDSFSEFNQALQDGYYTVEGEGTWDTSLATDEFTATCPDCGGSGGSATFLRNPYDTIVIETDEAPDEHPNRTKKIGASASLSEKRLTYFEAVGDSLQTELACGCGHTAKYDSPRRLAETTTNDLPEPKKGQSALSYAFADDSFTIECPACNGEGGTATLFDTPESDLLVVEVSQAPTCPSCGEYVVEAGFKSGPDAPEIGWEYYECPDCNARTRPETVDL